MRIVLAYNRNRLAVTSSQSEGIAFFRDAERAAVDAIALGAPGQRVQEVLARRARASWRGLFGDDNRIDVVERGRNSNLHPGASIWVHSERGPTCRGRSGPDEPQLIGPLARKRDETADREMAASVDGDENPRTRPWLAGAGEDHDTARTTRQCFDLWSGRRPWCVANEFALKHRVPGQEHDDHRGYGRPSRDAKPIRQDCSSCP